MPITGSLPHPIQNPRRAHHATAANFRWPSPTSKPQHREAGKKDRRRRIVLVTMSSQGGLSRRRVANQSTLSTTPTDSSSNQDSRNDSTNGSSNHTQPQSQSQSHSHGGSAFRGGGGIAYDPRDLDMTEEDGKGGKMPRLTIMEEVLLLGLKDKQVRPVYLPSLLFSSWNRVSTWSDRGQNPQQFPCSALLVRLLQPF